MGARARLAIALLGLAVPVRAQTVEHDARAAERPIAAARLQGDVELLRRAMTELHPGLWRALAPDEVEESFDELARRWSSDRTLREAYLDLTEFAARFRCGHTWASFFNQSKAVEAALFDPIRVVPFAFEWIDGEMIVTATAGSLGPLVRGGRIDAIDGVRVATIREKLMRFARADGGNDAKRLAQLAVTGREGREAFDLWFALAWPRPGESPYRIEGAAIDGTAFAIEAPALRAVDRERQLAAAAPVRAASEAAFSVDGWSASHPAVDVAMLRMDSWVTWKTKGDWNAELDAWFDWIAVDGTRHLVVDLRANEGGSDCGNAILARRIDRPLHLPPVVRHVRYERTSKELDPILDTWDDSFRAWRSAVTPEKASPALLGEAPGGFLRLRRDASDDVLATLAPSRRPRFGGRLWVLTSAVNSSATFQFAEVVKQARLGTLVGQSTGGNQRGIDGGCFFFVRLPGSGLEIDLPLIAFTPCREDGSDPGPVPDAGIAPDIEVLRTRRDVAAGVDSELRAALAAIDATR